MKGKIIVVTHKDYQMPQYDNYLPVCVGDNIASLSGHYQPDNVGDNISDRNKTYCELTAVYWAWKNLNLQELDYIGIAHYRRHFSTRKKAHTIDAAICEKELSAYSEFLREGVLVPFRRSYHTSIEKHYIYSLKGYENIHKQDIHRLREAVHACSPEYDECADKVLTGNHAHMLNMFIMTSKHFDAYCSWLFPIIDRVVAESGDREDQRRYAGALSEFCLDIWLSRNGIPAKELNLLETEPVSFFKKVVSYLKRKLG